MCYAILRITYRSGNDSADVKVGNAQELEGKVIDFQNNEQVTRIEVFVKTEDLNKRAVWEDKMKEKT